MKKMTTSIIGGMVIGFIIIFIIISVWFSAHENINFTNETISFLGLDIMNVEKIDGENVKEINVLSATIIGMVCSSIIYFVYSIVERVVWKKEF